MTIRQENFTVTFLAGSIDLFHALAYFILKSGKMHMPCRAKESYAVYFFVRADLVDHFVNLRAIILQHLEVRSVQDDFADRFDIILGILQKNLFEGADIKKGKERDSNQQYEAGPEDILADQTFAKGPEHDRLTRSLADKKNGR